MYARITWRAFGGGGSRFSGHTHGDYILAVWAQGLRICIPGRFPGDFDTAHMRTMF